MSKELVISANRHETKVAILEDDQLVEVFFQRANEYSLAGSIHKGRVTRVLPGMQSAFVDLGLERDTFLYVSDFFEENEEFDRVPVTRERSAAPDARTARQRPSRRAAESPPQPSRARSGSAASRRSAERGTACGSAAARIERRSERPTDGDRAAIAGRRSRRRRDRGRGFPDSKYASADASRPPRLGEAARSRVSEPRRAESASSRSDSGVESRPSRPARGSRLRRAARRVARQVHALQHPAAG